jgi:hypothetical protein
MMRCYLVAQAQSGPQGLKPYLFCGVCGTDKSVPLSKTEFSAASEGRRFM